MTSRLDMVSQGNLTRQEGFLNHNGFANGIWTIRHDLWIIKTVPPEFEKVRKELGRNFEL